MDIISLIKTALCALTSYLELKNKACYYDMIEKSKNTQDQIINEIQKLRNSKTNDSNDRADILRDKLVQEKAYLQHLSTFYTLSGKG